MTGPDAAVGESPVWNPQDASLYWVDIPGRCIHRLHPESGARARWATAEMTACIAFATDGSLVAGMESGIFALRLGADGNVSADRLAAPELPLPRMRFNDGRCDRQGRFWSGTMHMDMAAGHAAGALYRYSGEHGIRGPFASGLLTQNGLAWSPRGDRMYLSDSHPRARLVWAFDYDVDEGVPGERSVFVDMRDERGRPDGAAVDVDGCYWICGNDGGVVMRFTPQGKLDRKIDVPVAKPTMCAFGGARLDTLYVTSMRSPDPALAEPLAGALFAIRPGVQGLAETPFGVSRQ